MNQTHTDAWTIKRLLEWTAEYFRKQQRDSPRLAAEVLLAESLGCRRIDLYARYDEVPAEPHRTRFRDWVRRHAAGEPVAYLVGHRDFYSLRFTITPHVLIPRPETEELVLAALDEIKSWDRRDHSVVDVGTGSGCIAVTLAHQVPELRVIAIDISPETLEVARQNAIAHGVADRLTWLQSDLLSALPSGFQTPLIVSNPPYVGETDLELDPHVRQYEPHQALFAGSRGAELSERLLVEAPRFLAPEGLLIVETSPMLAESLRQFAESSGAYHSVELINDLARRPRLLKCRRNR